jgi:hypothetical protein
MWRSLKKKFKIDKLEEKILLKKKLKKRENKLRLK